MTTFTTLTEKEILTHAWNSIAELWAREFDLCGKAARNGEIDEIAQRREKKFSEQLNEIHDRLIELENGAA